MVMHNLLTKERSVLKESRTSVFSVGSVCVCGMQDTDSGPGVEAVNDRLRVKC